MAVGADLIFTKDWRHPQSAASGLFIALVIQIPAVSALGRGSGDDDDGDDDHDDNTLEVEE